MTTPTQVYKCYISLKLHFTSDYDFFEYKGKVKASYDSLQSRNDKMLFEKIAKHRDPYTYILSNFVVNNQLYVGDFEEANYERYKRVTGSLKHIFQNSISKLGDIRKSITVQNSQSELMNMYMSGKIEPEVMCILDKIFGFLDYWSKNLTALYYVNIIQGLRKYSPFLQVDLEEYKKLIHK